MNDKGGSDDHLPVTSDTKVDEREGIDILYRIDVVNSLRQIIGSGKFRFIPAHPLLPVNSKVLVDNVLSVSNESLHNDHMPVRGDSAHNVAAAYVDYVSTGGGLVTHLSAIKRHVKPRKASDEMRSLGRVISIGFQTTVPIGIVEGRRTKYERMKRGDVMLLSKLRDLITADVINWQVHSTSEKIGFLEDIGRLMAAYHHVRIFHNDLQLKNIAFEYTEANGEEYIFFIDFENCHRPVSKRKLDYFGGNIVRGLKVFMNSLFANRGSFQDVMFLAVNPSHMAEVSQNDNTLIENLMRQVILPAYYLSLAENGEPPGVIQRIQKRIEEAFLTGEIWSNERLRQHMRRQNDTLH